jgi:hypothetical protein
MEQTIVTAVDTQSPQCRAGVRHIAEQRVNSQHRFLEHRHGLKAKDLRVTTRPERRESIMTGRYPTNQESDLMYNRRELKRILLNLATTQIELCRILIGEGGAVRWDTNHGIGSKGSPSRLQLHRARLWDRVRRETASMIKDGAITGSRLDAWLEDNPNAEITRATEVQGKRDAVLKILKRLRGGENIQEMRELLGIIEDVSDHAIKQSLKGRERWNREH